MTDSCTKCYHFSPIKIKKDLYSLFCEKHALPEVVNSKKDLEFTAEYCKFYTGGKKKKLDKKPVWK